MTDPWKNKDEAPLRRIETFQQAAERLIAQLKDHLPALDEAVIRALNRADAALKDARWEARATKRSTFYPSAAKRLEILEDEYQRYTNSPGFSVRMDQVLCGPLTPEEFKLFCDLPGVSSHDFLIEQGLTAYPTGAVWAVCPLEELDRVTARAFVRGLRSQQKAELAKKIEEARKTLETLEPRPVTPEELKEDIEKTGDPTIITHKEADALHNACPDHGIGFLTDYSGRGMLGKQCLGFVINGEDAPGLSQVLESVLGKTRASLLIQNYRSDGMGTRMVLYAPKWEVARGYTDPEDHNEDDKEDEA